MVDILAGTFKKYYFTLGRKIIDFNTLEEHGFLLIDLEEVILEQAYTSIKDNESSEVFCDHEGRIIGASQKERIGEHILGSSLRQCDPGQQKGAIQ